VVQITALAADADATTNTITYSLHDDDGGRFAIDSVTGIVTVAGAIDREADGPSRNITVRATSSDGSFTDQSFSIAISDVDEFNVGPVTDSNATANNVNENASVGTVVQITALAADTDATTNTITYSLQDDDGGRFAIDSVTGNVTVAGAIDREADGPSRNITVRATSSDGSFTDQSFSIAINDVDEFNVGPVTDTNTTANNVNENASVGTVVQITALAADADATTNTITYSLHDDDGGRFAIDSVTGIVTVAGAIDREADGPSRTITVRATSSDGSFTDQTFSIAINDVDEFDVGPVTDTNATANNVNENASVGTVVQITALAADADATTSTITYSLHDDDGGRFAIDSVTGIVTVAGAIDREADGPSRTITVRATSSDGSFTDQTFSIAINDVDEFDVGPVTDTNATANNVNENASVGTVVQITALAADADATTSTITYSLHDDDGGRFAIDSVTGIVTVAGAIDREADGPSRTITVRATSSDGSFTDQTFSIAINDVDEFDVGLLVDIDSSLNIVQEHSVNGTVVGLTILALDIDATINSITYQLLDDAQGRFTIDANTGIITVADSSMLRFELGPNYTLTVRADSTDGSFNTAVFQLTLDNLNDAPFAVDDVFNLNENGIQNLNVLSNDYDLDPADSLQIVSAIIATGLGNITFAGNSISYNPGTSYDYLSVGESATVELSYTISDAAGLQSTAMVTLTILGDRDPLVLDAPSIISSEDNVLIWNISITPIDTHGEILASVIVSGLPDGTILYDTFGQLVLVFAGTDTELIDFDLQHIEIALPQHVSGTFSIVVETLSNLGNNSLQSIVRDWYIAAIADTPTLFAQAARGQLGEVINLRLDSDLIDVDGSEQLTIEVRGLPLGMTLTDGTFQHQVTPEDSWIDVSNWDLAQLVLQTSGGRNGIYTLEIRATSAEELNQGSISNSLPFQLIVDEVLPVLDSAEFEGATELIPYDTTDNESQEKLVIYHSSHEQGHIHIHSNPIDTFLGDNRRSKQNAAEPESPLPIRLDSPSNSLSAPSFSRSRPISADVLVLNHVTTIRTNSDSLAPVEPSHELSHDTEGTNSLYSAKQTIPFFANVNNTLLLAWTMIRSSVANFLSQNDGFGSDDRKNTPIISKNDEKFSRESAPSKK
jgi:hypothetical protein